MLTHMLAYSSSIALYSRRAAESIPGDAEPSPCLKDSIWGLRPELDTRSLYPIAGVAGAENVSAGMVLSPPMCRNKGLDFNT